MRTMSQIASEDKRMMAHVFRNYRMTPSEAKIARMNELAADSFRIEGRYENVVRNSRLGKGQQAKRSWR